MADRSSAPYIHMGVVSPCSTCKNKRAVSQDGLPACPRRFWMDVAAQEDSDAPEFLSASGTDQPDKLVNPVYLEDQNTVVVWAAALEDNNGIFENGNRINPDILNPGFDTTYIGCRLRPYVIQDSEANLRSAGAYKEGDQLQLMTFQVDQQDIAGERIPLAGFARKVTFNSCFRFLIPDEDLLVPGT